MQVGNHTQKRLDRRNIIQRHHTVPLTDATVVDAIIYLVFQKTTPGPMGTNENPANDIVRYVGQTCAQQGIAARFTQHLNSGLHPMWSHQTHYIRQEYRASLTKFEATCLGQAHIEAYSSSLENRQNALRKVKFDLYKNTNTLRPAVASQLLGRPWEPHQ